MFFLKKLITPLFYPLSSCLIIMSLGLVFLLFKRKQGWGKFFIILGMASLALFSYEFAADGLLGPLERQYQPINTARLTTAAKDEIKWIVVLGGGNKPDPRLPATAQLTEETSARLVEALRLHRELPGCRILVSGGAVFNSESEAQVMARAAELLGIKPQNLVLEPDSRDTEEEAVLIRKIVGADRFILVTTASHMPRSVALFRKTGLDPIPAPTQFLVTETKGTGIHPGAFYPNPRDLVKSGLAIHEYLGILWSKMRGKI
ncbi:MAG: ElyC/SanA/YdcF family protein [Syntrophales bacterium]|nr:ElyC/SanA/YdcF family protein [Syntrophales bacterium]